MLLKALRQHWESFHHCATVKMALCHLLPTAFPAPYLSPGAVARSCNPATWRQVLWDGLRRGLLLVTGSCWSGVRTKACINMVTSAEAQVTRLPKEGRTGPGGKPSSQEFLCGPVVGPRQWVPGGQQPLQHSQTQNFWKVWSHHPSNINENCFMTKKLNITFFYFCYFCLAIYEHKLLIKFLTRTQVENSWRTPEENSCCELLTRTADANSRQRHFRGFGV